MNRMWYNSLDMWDMWDWGWVCWSLTILLIQNQREVEWWGLGCIFHFSKACYISKTKKLSHRMALESSKHRMVWNVCSQFISSNTTETRLILQHCCFGESWVSGFWRWEGREWSRSPYEEFVGWFCLEYASAGIYNLVRGDQHVTTRTWLVLVR